MITYIIIGITSLISLLTMERNDLKGKYMFNAFAIAHHREWWRFFTGGFLHANFAHLFVNMLSLYFFGPAVEAKFIDIFGPVQGEVNYALLYVGGLLFSCLFSFFKEKDNPYYNALGASGAVSSIVFAAILVMPRMKMGLMILPIMVPGWIFGSLYLIYSQYMSKKKMDNVGHDAHFWGAAYGFLLPILMKPELFVIFITELKHTF